MPDDLQDLEDRFRDALLRECSFKRIRPAQDFSGADYLTYLNVATESELKTDTLTESTYRAIFPKG